jgi:hypothetical protein
MFMAAPKSSRLALVNSTYHMTLPAARDHIYRRTKDVQAVAEETGAVIE